MGYYIYSEMSDIEIDVDAEPTPGVDENQQLEHLEHPNLDRPINIPEDFPEDAKKIATEKIQKLSNELKANNDFFDGWLDLGIYRKMIGDYEGAKECWEYASAIRPLNSISFNNLGDLYGYYLKDYKKAEENFLKALENGPDQVYIYRNTYEFYRYVMKDDAQAKEILKKGIEINPDTSQDLKTLFDNY